MANLAHGDSAAFCKEESFKKEAFERGLPVVGDLPANLRDARKGTDLSEAVKHLAKSHGLYLQWNRANTGLEKDWRYMVRVTIPGGGPITAAQYAVLDDIANRYARDPDGSPSLRLTTRQNIQFHWIKLENIVDTVRDIAASGFYTLNGCGDNVRNVMGCPISTGSELFDSNALARKVGSYFRLDPEAHIQVFAIDPHYIRAEHGEVRRFDYGPNLLNRKFKIGISSARRTESGAIEYDNCVEALTNDIAIAPVVENGRVDRFMVYVGGGQGERNGKESISTLARPFGVFKEADLMAGLDAIVRYHRDFGEREHRHLARMKFVVKKDGVEAIQEGAKALGAVFEPPIPGFDIGPRHLHHGWIQQPERDLVSYGAFIENGRLRDGGPNGDLKSMVLSALTTFGGKLVITPSQDLLFKDIPVSAKNEFEAHLKSFGYGSRNGAPFSNLRMFSLACVGTPTCSLAMADSEVFEPVLIDKLESMNGGKYSGICESIGVSGCERQCSRPGTKVMGWIGAGKDLYKLKLGGTEDARHQGELLIEEGGQGYLTRVPKDKVPEVTAALFDFYLENRLPGEGMGYFHQRIGIRAVIEHLKRHPAVSELMARTQEMKLAVPSSWLEGTGAH